MHCEIIEEIVLQRRLLKRPSKSRGCKTLESSLEDRSSPGISQQQSLEKPLPSKFQMQRKAINKHKLLSSAPQASISSSWVHKGVAGQPTLLKKKQQLEETTSDYQTRKQYHIGQHRRVFSSMSEVVAKGQSICLDNPEEHLAKTTASGIKESSQCTSGNGPFEKIGNEFQNKLQKKQKMFISRTQKQQNSFVSKQLKHSCQLPPGFCNTQVSSS